MDWLHSSFNKDLYPNFEPSLFKSNDSSVNDANGSQFMIAQLKQAYQERFRLTLYFFLLYRLEFSLSKTKSKKFIEKLIKIKYCKRWD